MPEEEPIDPAKPQKSATIVVRPFQPGDKAAFQRLNEAWIRRYFALVPQDHEILGNPEDRILRRGGEIFFAIADDLPVGCCALIPHASACYEVGKMAVHEDYQRRGIGGRLMEAAIEAARKMGAKRLYLETNHTLGPALRLYRRAGFVPLPATVEERSDYSRSDVLMELWL